MGEGRLLGADNETEWIFSNRENSCLHYLNASPFHRSINWLFDHRRRCGVADKAELISKVARGRGGERRRWRWDSAADEIKWQRSRCEAAIAASVLQLRSGSGRDLIPPSRFLTSFLPAPANLLPVRAAVRQELPTASLSHLVAKLGGRPAEFKGRRLKWAAPLMPRRAEFRPVHLDGILTGEPVHQLRPLSGNLPRRDEQPSRRGYLAAPPPPSSTSTTSSFTSKIPSFSV